MKSLVKSVAYKFHLPSDSKPSIGNQFLVKVNLILGIFCKYWVAEFTAPYWTFIETHPTGTSKYVMSLMYNM